MKKIAIVHYLPIEYYPPATNFLNFLANSFPEDCQTFVYSSANIKERIPYQNKHIKTFRFPFPKGNDHPFTRLIKYLTFNLGTLMSLLWRNPDSLLYYESYSAWPVYWFLRLRGRHCKLMIHYHEYSPPEWYESGMKTVKNYYKKEKNFLWKRTAWISHTNEDRVSFFKNDYPFIDHQKLKVLPNYPPRSWYSSGTIKTDSGSAIRSVYVGSLSLTSTYIKEYCEWVIGQKGKITFSIYSYNLHEDTSLYLKSLNSPHIKFIKKGLDYSQIPAVLSTYHVGLILYKGETENFKYNAPNKLFEYISCGLDVWYPKEMLGMKPYQTKNTVPKIIEMDFQLLNRYDINFLYGKSSCKELKQVYFCEEVYQKLAEELNE